MRDEFVSGYLQVYTGDGKGKTTASVGLAVRALGAGINVFFAQFIKGGRYSEIEALEILSASRAGLGKLLSRQYGRGCFIMRSPEAEDITAAEDGLEDARHEMKSGRYRLVILDEANVAVKLGLLREEALLGFARERPEDVELVITGRGATDRLIALADLVTEMREVKHYYQKGVMARKGIES
jgi:cob(I)alamin adenosyltransferase